MMSPGSSRHVIKITSGAGLLARKASESRRDTDQVGRDFHNLLLAVRQYEVSTDATNKIPKPPMARVLRGSCVFVFLYTGPGATAKAPAEACSHRRTSDTTPGETCSPRL